MSLASLLIVIAYTKTIDLIKLVDPDAASNNRFIGFLILYIVVIPINLIEIKDILLYFI
jgi:hypothetical protein